MYHILRNAGVLEARRTADLAVCWGGHSISREEYDYTKKVGYELGLRGMDVCTGCGPGAMKGPMKGATIGHSKQRITNGRYIGLTEPGIVAAEPPNPIVSHLVIMPDIEKRLEAFVRLGHGIIVFPGGAGTAEEILYLLGVLLDPANAEQPMPVVFTGPASAAGYFARIDEFVGANARTRGTGPLPDHRRRSRGRGPRHRRRCRRGARLSPRDRRLVSLQLEPVDTARYAAPLRGQPRVGRAFAVGLAQPVHVRAANLRRIFSAIVAGNVKDRVSARSRSTGRFASWRSAADAAAGCAARPFIAQRRMKLSGEYKPVYRIVT